VKLARLLRPEDSGWLAQRPERFRDVSATIFSRQWSGLHTIKFLGEKCGFGGLAQTVTVPAVKSSGLSARIPTAH
jgi:hypothetical protein